MSAIGIALYSIARNSAAVRALIGESGSPQDIRLYAAGDIPQSMGSALDLIPAATYQTIGGAPANTLERAAPADNERIQIDAWALDIDSADALLDALRLAWENDDQQIYFGVGIQIVSFNGKDYNDITKRYRSSLDVSVWMARGNVLPNQLATEETGIGIITE